MARENDIPTVRRHVDVDWSTGTVGSLVVEEIDEVVTDEVVTVEAARAAPPSEEAPPTAKRPPPPLPPRKPPPPPAPPGRRLVDEGEIARGGMGAIHRVRDVLIMRYAAMKVLEGADRRPDARVRFVREAQILGQLNHPNIVPVYDIGTTAAGIPTFTMKLVDGTTLTHYLRDHDVGEGERELERVLRMMLTVCDAVSFAHSRGVVHRDLKPDNIMIGAFGQVYVMDWGCAGLLSDAQFAKVSNADAAKRVSCFRVADLDAPGTILGTGSYMAPEQAWGKTDELDERTDVFALGAILYQILTGVPPFRAASAIETIRVAQKCEILAPQDAAGRELPRALCRITMKALAASPAERHPNVAALKKELEDLLHGGAWLTSQRFPKGTAIVLEGEEATAAYIITRGRCDVYKTEGGRRVTLRSLGPGDVFGETAMFASQARTATVEAAEEVVAMVVTREALESQLAMDSWMGALVRALAERFTDLDEQMARSRRSPP